MGTDFDHRKYHRVIVSGWRTYQQCADALAFGVDEAHAQVCTVRQQISSIGLGHEFVATRLCKPELIGTAMHAGEFLQLGHRGGPAPIGQAKSSGVRSRVSGEQPRLVQSGEQGLAAGERQTAGAYQQQDCQANAQSSFPSRSG